MRDPRWQLTKKQKLGASLLLICCWASLFGIYWTLFKDIRDGLIISGAGAIGSGVVYVWLGYINYENE